MVKLIYIVSFYNNLANKPNEIYVTPPPPTSYCLYLNFVAIFFMLLSFMLLIFMLFVGGEV